MIRFNLALRNLFAKDRKYRSFVELDCHIIGTKHKNFQFQIDSGSSYYWLDVTIDLSWRGHDHAGPNFEIGIFGFRLSFGIYDNRHWDYDLGCWKEKN